MLLLLKRARHLWSVHSFPTRRSSDLPVLRLEDVRAEGVEAYVHRFGDGTGNWPRRPKGRGPSRERPYELDISSLTITDEIGRAHVCTPVTVTSRMPSYACYKYICHNS